MILDTSAVVAVLFEEPEADEFIDLIRAADQCRFSVASFLELTIVLARQAGPDANRRAETFLRQIRASFEPVTLDQAMLARQAFFDYGKGRHPGGLNFGDCFAYALSKSMREPLLFKGNDFRQTDVMPAA